MSNISVLFVEKVPKVKKFCREGNSFRLRESRARLVGLSGGPGRRIEDDFFCVHVYFLHSIMLATLLTAIRGERENDRTYYYEKYLEQLAKKEIPYLYGAWESNAPWLWKIPDEIISHLAELDSKKELSDLARLWKEAEIEISCEPKVRKEILADMRKAALESARTGDPVLLYVST